ncbi:MAG: hypothetical protein AAFP84_01595 [Actinomycetota bacterium]
MAKDADGASVAFHVSARTIGRRGAGVERRRLELPPTLPPTIELRTLIEHVVSSEVSAFERRREGQSVLRFLTNAEVRADAALGVVRLGAHVEATDDEPIDVDRAVERALLAFDDGLFKVMVDGQDITELRSVVTLHDDTDVMFVRLVALAGG